MDVIAHEDVSKELEEISGPAGREDVRELLIVGGVFEYLLTLVAARDNVIESAFVFDAGLTGHSEKEKMQGLCQYVIF